MLIVKSTKLFEKDLRRISKQKSVIKELDLVVKLLSENKPLPLKYKDHQLKGQFKDLRECHVKPDMLLIYKKLKKELILILIRLGSHAELF